MRIDPDNPHLPPHLREACALLAAGLLRLRSRTAQDLAHDAAMSRDHGDCPLHFSPEPSGCVLPNRRAA